MTDVLAVALVRYPDNPESVDLELRVNGLPLVEVAVAAGLPPPEQDLKEWVYPPARLLRTDHFVEGPDRWENDEGSGAYPAFGDHDTALLADGCGQPGCAALLADIRVDSDSVRWSRFRSYHAGRRERRLRIGPFVFDRSQYESALRDARREL